MSGPKVVRVVTREEVIAICQGEIARVDAAIAEWLRLGERNDCISKADIAETAKRRAALDRMLAESRFVDLQKHAPLERAHLAEDIERRLTKVAEAAAAANRVERRQADVARALLERIAKRGIEASADLTAALALAAGGRPDQKAISEAFALLGGGDENSVNTELARRLGEGLERRTFNTGGNVEDEADEVLALEARIAEARAFDEDAARPLEDLLQGARSAQPRHRALLLDSVAAEIQSTLGAVRRWKRLASELSQTNAELTLLGRPAHPLPPSRDESSLISALAAADDAVASARKADAAGTRRTAVLTGLAAIGYEVTEGMETAWVENGRLVLRSAARPSYGMEVAGDPAGDRLQIRPIAYRSPGEAADRGRDNDAEAIWCGDVTTLQSALADAGGGLVIERATPLGVTPLKAIAGTGREDRFEAREGRANDKLRRL